MEQTSSVNYIEYIKIKDSHNIDDIQSFNTALTKDEFIQFLYKMKKYNYKSFTKIYKQYNQDDIIYNNYENKEIKIYTIKPISHELLSNGFIKISYKKTKKNIQNIFPNIISYVKKFSFRVNNRIYVNFETSITEDDEFFKIYINYNHEKNVDMEVINKEIDTIINIFN